LRFAIVVLTYFVVGWWVFENARASSGGARVGLSLVDVGWTLNLLVIIPNRGMPVSGSALVHAGIVPSTSVTVGHLSKHVSVNHSTVLSALGDVIPLSWFRSVISIGDIVMAVGIGLLVATALKGPAAGHSPGATPEPLAATRIGGGG
jgi:hypothetical protein